MKCVSTRSAVPLIICEKCLLGGYIQEKKLIDDILVKRVIKNECE